MVLLFLVEETTPFCVEWCEKESVKHFNINLIETLHQSWDHMAWFLLLLSTKTDVYIILSADIPTTGNQVTIQG